MRGKGRKEEGKEVKKGRERRGKLEDRAGKGRKEGKTKREEELLRREKEGGMTGKREEGGEMGREEGRKEGKKGGKRGKRRKEGKREGAVLSFITCWNSKYYFAMLLSRDGSLLGAYCLRIEGSFCRHEVLNRRLHLLNLLL